MCEWWLTDSRPHTIDHKKRETDRLSYNKLIDCQTVCQRGVKAKRHFKGAETWPGYLKPHPTLTYNYITLMIIVMKPKHFILLARVLRTYKNDIPRETYAQMVGLLCSTLTHFNPRFKPSMFKSDCGVQD